MIICYKTINCFKIVITVVATSKILTYMYEKDKHKILLPNIVRFVFII